MKISACVITKNEEQNLPYWITSMRIFADEMIVVDTGSTDATVEIARAGGAVVYYFDWINDFAAAKNFALDRASGDWVVFTDADEYFTDESAPRVRPLVEAHDAEERIDGFIVRLVNIDMETGALLGTTAQVQRIFRRLPHLRFVGSIHEHVENLSGDPARTMLYAEELVLYHTGYSPQIMRQKSERDLELLSARRAAGHHDKMDAYHLMDCYYTLEDYEKAAAYAREAMDLPEQPVGGEKRPHTVLLQSLILMNAADAEIDAAYHAALGRFPETADFPFIYGTYAWERGYLAARAVPMRRACVSMRSITVPAISPACSLRSPMSGSVRRRSCAGKRKPRRRSISGLCARKSGICCPSRRSCVCSPRPARRRRMSWRR